MMKELSSLLLIGLLVISCSSREAKIAQNDKNEPVSESDHEPQKERDGHAHSTPDFSVALTFINDYTRHCISVDMDKWIPKHRLLAQDFKNAYKALVDSVRKEDPEMGLDFDPIFDAQDYPDKGFFVQKIDSADGYVTVEGRNWKDFTVLLKVVSKNGKSLVDGAGIINMPKDKLQRCEE